MQRLYRAGGLAAGATLGGLAVGVAEGAYRGVDLAYAGMFYAALWAMVGIGLALLTARAFARTPPGLITFGAATALVSSTIVLVRFIVLRDIYLEAPGKGLAAGAWALAAGVGMLFPVLMTSNWLRRRIFSRFARSPAWWALPFAALAAFGIRVVSGQDDGSALPAAPHTLRGEGTILVVVDALRADMLGAYGAPAHRDSPPSPAFDAWLEQGRRFDDVTAHASWTKAAVASIMTSRHASGHDTMSKVAVLPQTLPTIAKTLADAGVKTAAVVTNYNLEEGYGFDNGFAEYRYLPPARYLGAPARANRLAAYNVYRVLREKLFTAGRSPKDFFRDGGTVNAHAFEILDHIGDEKFFLYLHYMEPHDPYFAVDGTSYARVTTPNPPLEAAGAMRDAYRDGVKRWDGYFGELLAGLAARGLTDRVRIVVTADHGEEFGEHGGFWHGTTLYEEQLRVPLAMRGPGIATGVDPHLARQIDVAPTIAAFHSVGVPATWEGRDLRSETAAPSSALAEENHEGNVLTSVRQGGRKLILANDGNPRGLSPVELYDLNADPAERKPLRDDATTLTLTTAIERLKREAKRGGAESTVRPVDAAVESELRALGYVK